MPGHRRTLSFGSSDGRGSHQVGECSGGEEERVIHFTEDTDSPGGLVEVIVIGEELGMLLAKGYIKSLH